MKYRLVCDPDFECFEEIINSYLEKGWSLYGDISVYQDNNQQVLMQALIKEN